MSMANGLTQRSDFLRLVRELGVRVESPFAVLNADANVEFEAYLPDFGGKRGMVLSINDMRGFDDLGDLARAAGLYYSSLNATAPTSEQSVKDTLDDWGYFGPEDRRPDWYTGKPWTAQLKREA